MTCAYSWSGLPDVVPRLRSPNSASPQLICSQCLSRGKQKLPPDGSPWVSLELLDQAVTNGRERVLATRGQTDIRGLVTAGRAVRLEASAGLRGERGNENRCC